VIVAPAQMGPIVDAVQRGGGIVVEADADADADAVIWMDPSDPDGLGALLRKTSARWVQLPFAGIEEFFDAGVIDPERTWTCAKIIYGPACAELALALIGVAARSIHRHVLERRWWRGDFATHRRIAGTTAVVVGTGGIGTALTRMLLPLGVRVLAVNRSGRPLDGAERTVTDVRDVAGEADWLVIAAAMTHDTRHLVDAELLSLMKHDAWIVNVARGGLVDTNALLDALKNGVIGGAALDVTDPEPLPDDHPLWSAPNVIVTSHTANTIAMAIPELAGMVERNVRSFANGEPLEGLVDVKAGY
jgi:D-3-phosphoglycerate dehydrogenase